MAPGDAQETWSPVETDKRQDWRWHAGIYQSGGHRMALNRPEAEDAPRPFDPARLPEMLRGGEAHRHGGRAGIESDRLQSEIWPTMVVLTMLFMCAEMAIATTRPCLPIKPGMKSTASRPVTKRPSAEVEV